MYPNPPSVRPTILAAARRNHLDPELLLAVIQTESHFRSDAVSARGARGLMQIMPATGRWLWPKVFPGGTFHASVLDDPVTNVQLGAFYLGLLVKQYKGNTSLALAAYNGGGANVQKWLESGNRSRKTFLQSVAFPETKHFVIKVWVAYVIYHALYPSW